VAASLSVARIDASLDSVAKGNILLINQEFCILIMPPTIPASDSKDATPAIPPNSYRVLLTGFGVRSYCKSK
jgi:hypothetical protein